MKILKEAYGSERTTNINREEWISKVDNQGFTYIKTDFGGNANCYAIVNNASVSIKNHRLICKTQSMINVDISKGSYSYTYLEGGGNPVSEYKFFTKDYSITLGV